MEQSGESGNDPEDQVAAALAAVGLKASEPIQLDEPFALWPDNVGTFNLWMRVQTQWHRSEGRVTGLDYAGVESLMRLQRIPARERGELFAGLQVMERAALIELASLNRRRNTKGHM